MNAAAIPRDFFVTGGTLWREAPSYIRRPADDELLELTLAGEYGNVLAARQMGKSSLMVRTAQRLRARGIQTAILDLSLLGGEAVSAAEWYFGLCDELARQFDLDTDLEAWWQTYAAQGPVQRFGNFLRDVLLAEITAPIVIFLDEIDATLGLDFTDDFFAIIRAAYNARAEHLAYQRLSFVLVGVAQPADLIKDRTRTPYNIGLPIALTDFRLEELDSFRSILNETYPGEGAQILEWVLDWTGGQPYLTQKLCAALMEQPGSGVLARQIDQWVARLFLGDQARTESNLRAIRDRIFNNPYKTEMLRLYRDLLRGKTVLDEERSRAKNELKLTGLVRAAAAGRLRISNRIYRQVYDRAWVRENLPVPRAQRVALFASLLAMLAMLIAGYTLYRQSQQTAQTYIAQFESSASSDVRLTSLARLLELGDENALQARNLFWELPDAQRMAFFGELSNPQNLAAELITVVSAVYQKAEDTPPGNALLHTMELALSQVSAPGAASLRTEIDFWLKGRQVAAVRGNLQIAISYYDRAWEESLDRGQPNAGIRFERALALATLGEYQAALQEFAAALALNPDYSPQISAQLNQNADLGVFWAQNTAAYAELSAAIGSQIATQPPSASTTVTATREPGAPLSPTEAPTSEPMAVVTYTLDIAFASDREGEFGVYLMTSENPETWEALSRPPEYERVWWPAFCGNNLLAEVHDLDGFQPQWIYFLATEDPKSVRWNVPLENAKIGVPRCTQDADYIAYSAYIPQDYAEWVLLILSNRERDEYVITGTQTLAAPAYLSWTRDGSSFLAMIKRDEKFYIQRTDNFPANQEPEEIIKGKYPAISPDGSRLVYLCADQLYLCLMDLGTGKIIFLTEVRHVKVRGETLPLTAMWSSDSQWVYFASAPEGQWDIFRVHPDGSDLQNLTRAWGDSNEIMPALKWQD